MNDSSYSNSTEETTAIFIIPGLSPIVRLWLLLVFDTIAIISTLIMFFLVVVDQKVRSSLKNHSLIVILILFFAIQTIDIPLYIHFLINPSGTFLNPTICQMWQFVDFTMYNGGIIIITWTAFERHIIIYHNHWLIRKKRRILLHYMPLLILLTYILVFYIYVFFFFSCTNIYFYNLPLCGGPSCYLGNPVAGTIDILANSAIPSILEAVFSISFLFRFIWHRYNANLGMQWRKQRKMVIQLMFISCLNFILLLPWNVMLIIQLFGASTNVTDDVKQSFYFLAYFTPMLFPCICLLSMNGMKQIFQKTIHAIRQKFRQFPVIS